MRTPHTGRPPVPDLVSSSFRRQVERDVLLCLPPLMYTHTYTNNPLTHWVLAQSGPLRVWGNQLRTDGAPQGGQPPWAASGSETAHLCPRDKNGKGGHLARPVSCGVSPAQSPGLGQSHSPSHRHKRPGSPVEGALPHRCPGAGPQVPLRLMGDDV